MEGENRLRLHSSKEPSIVGFSTLVDPEKPALDIVFIHGFTGHPERTWTYKGERSEHDGRLDDEQHEPPSKFRRLLPSVSNEQRNRKIRNPVYWPRDLVPLTIPNARVLTYGYDTHIRHSVFISTTGIIFFGTPHSGSDPRGWAQHIAERAIKAAGFSVNEQVVATLLPSSDRLRELRDEFGPRAREQNWIIYCFQEQYGVMALNGNKVVDDTSSCLNDLTIEVTQHIASNHMEMCRFSGPDDTQYKPVAAALERVVEAISRTSASSQDLLVSAEQRKIFLDSLKFDQIDARQMTIKSAHAKTCRWLLSKSEYRDWLDSDKLSEHHGFLWIKGKPGTGKSTIMKFVVAHVRKTMKDTILSFFFNARGEDLEKSTVGMYRSLLLQLLEGVPELQTVFDHFVSMIASNVDLYSWKLESLKELFGRAIRTVKKRKVVCLIDALDECNEDSIRDMVKFFGYLGEAAISAGSWFHVCFSSRHYPHITIGRGLELVLEGQEGHNQDIVSYLNAELNIGHSKKAEQVRDQILEKASGIFIWVVLVVQILNKEFDRGRIHALQQRLQDIPTDLFELFKDILTRDVDNQDDLLASIQWILFAKRPLKREEFYFAVLSTIEPAILGSWNPEEITTEDMERFIVNSLKGLAEVTKSRIPTVQFIHESVKDFFLKEHGISQLWSDQVHDFTTLSHDRLKESCHSCMSLDLSEHFSVDVAVPSTTSPDAAHLRSLVAEKFPLLEYAVHNVLYHADVAQSGGIQQGPFFDSFHVRRWILLDNLFEKHEIRRHTESATLMYLFAEQNLPSLIKVHPTRTQHLEVEGERYGFPLLVALVKGHQDAVRALLTANERLTNKPKQTHTTIQDVLPITHAKYERSMIHRKGRTLVSHIAERGDDSLLSYLLIKWNLNPNMPDKNGLTPLSWAAANGQRDVIRILLESGANVNLLSHDGRTPLYLAVENGQEALADCLLENATGTSFPTFDMNLLALAAHKHLWKVVELLSTRPIDIKWRFSNRMTLLHLAAADGQAKMVKKLLVIGADIDAQDLEFKTPLYLAARKEQREALRILVDKGADLEKRSWDSSTLLARMAEFNAIEAVRMLIDVGANIEAKNDDGLTVLGHAVSSEHVGVVKLLLEKGANVDVEDNYGRSPISIATSQLRNDIARLLLEKSVMS